MRNWRATPTLASQAQEELHLPCTPPPLWHHLVPTFSLSVLSHWALLGSLCEPAWEVRPTPTSMVYVLAFFRCLLSCHLITEGIPGLLTKILNLRLISQASLLDVYILICVSCCNTIFFRISSLCYTKM